MLSSKASRANEKTREDFAREAQSLYDNLRQLVEKARTGAGELETDKEKRDECATKFIDAASISHRLEALQR